LLLLSWGSALSLLATRLLTIVSLLALLVCRASLEEFELVDANLDSVAVRSFSICPLAGNESAADSNLASLLEILGSDLGGAIEGNEFEPMCSFLGFTVSAFGVLVYCQAHVADRCA
jgi:hypothetical protein